MVEQTHTESKRLHAQPVGPDQTAYRRLRRLLRRIGPLRSTYYLLRALGDYWRYSPNAVQVEFEDEFVHTKDPYGFDTRPEERERLQHALRMLEDVRPGARFGPAMEVGCAEGAFTEMLAAHCDCLLAVDLSPTALQRARSRRSWSEDVRFQQWNLGGEQVPGTFDLITVMSVLEVFHRPSAIREARDKLVEALQPQGYLLVSNVDYGPYQDFWWSRHLIRGHRHINQFFAQHPALQELATEEGNSYVHTLLQKVAPT